MPEPETAKLEEQLLMSLYKNIRAQIEMAILVADSLGKQCLIKEHLEKIKKELEKASHHFQ